VEGLIPGRSAGRGTAAEAAAAIAAAEAAGAAGFATLKGLAAEGVRLNTDACCDCGIMPAAKAAGTLSLPCATGMPPPLLLSDAAEVRAADAEATADPRRSGSGDGVEE